MAADETYERLRRAILDGELGPNERLVEHDVAVALGVSRAAARTAIVRLEQDRLVVHEINRGARVRAISMAEAVEILQARAALEAVAAREAATAASAADVDGLRVIVARMGRRREQGDLIAVSDCNAALHRRILEISGHATVQRLIAALNSQMVRYQYRTILLPGRAQRSLAEHRTIVEAIAGGDPTRSERAMRRHLDAVATALRASADSVAV